MKPTRLIYIFLLAQLMMGMGCNRNLEQAITYDRLPVEQKNTVLLVEGFVYQDPVVYDPYYTGNVDSVLALELFGPPEPDNQIEGGNQRPFKQKHPLIEKTNENLDQYNRKLAQTMRRYKYDHVIVKPGEADTNQAYADTDKYRYVLKYRPVLHCFVDPEGQTQLSYRYLYYFVDRKEQKRMPEIELYAQDQFRSLRAIVSRLNEGV